MTLDSSEPIAARDLERRDRRRQRNAERERPDRWRRTPAAPVSLKRDTAISTNRPRRNPICTPPPQNGRSDSAPNTASNVLLRRELFAGCEEERAQGERPAPWRRPSARRVWPASGRRDQSVNSKAIVNLMRRLTPNTDPHDQMTRRLQCYLAIPRPRSALRASMRPNPYSGSRPGIAQVGRESSRAPFRSRPDR